MVNCAIALFTLANLWIINVFSKSDFYYNLLTVANQHGTHVLYSGCNVLGCPTIDFRGQDRLVAIVNLLIHRLTYLKIEHDMEYKNSYYNKEKSRKLSGTLLEYILLNY